MFSSRTLTDRNNDPRPWVCPRCEMLFAVEPTLHGHSANFDPRPAYRYGTLPENPILVGHRRGTLDVGWFLHEYNHDTDSWIWGDDPITGAHVIHAVRVLTLLAAVNK